MPDELMEPLRKINCFSELLRRRIGADLDAKSREMLDHIATSAERLTALVEELLRTSS